MDYLDKKKKELRPEDFPKLKEIGSNQIMVGQYRSIGPYHREITFHYPETKNIMRKWSLDEDFG